MSKSNQKFNGKHPNPKQVRNPEWDITDTPDTWFYDEMIPLEVDKALMHEMAEAHPEATEVVVKRLHELKPEVERIATLNKFKPTAWSYLEELFPINKREVEELQGEDRFTFACINLVFSIRDRFHGENWRSDYDLRLGDSDGILEEFIRSYALDLLGE